MPFTTKETALPWVFPATLLIREQLGADERLPRDAGLVGLVPPYPRHSIDGSRVCSMP